SKSYLQLLDAWKRSKHKNNNKLFLVAGDVQALYPNVRRQLVRNGINEALTLCSDFNPTAIHLITELTMFCLENVVVQNGDKLYHQTEGIITGDNHSVSMANIALHHIMLPIHQTLSKAVLFKRYIDDIVWISESEELMDQIQTEILEAFRKNGLRLTFRQINTEETNNTLEFLDVNHVIDPGCTAGFRTINFVKPTAVGRLFLNGQSSHPRSIFKSIFFSEAIRMRRLNEKTDEYLKSLEKLKLKCWKSGFDRKMIADMMEIARMWRDRFAPPNNKKSKPVGQRVVWASCFPDLLRLSRRERELNKDAVVVYKRPQTLANQLLHYRNIEPSLVGSSSPCNRCKLCGKFGEG
ncbi:MAG: reverse transcriptase domain-containing protein, partial [Pseudomonadota bacterium]|nr:reverse transcriptase domain-containing protein [Pseudomonadota bacterium]